MRKIVADRVNIAITDDQIKEKIIKELFTFEIGTRIINKQSVIDYLEKDNKDVVEFFKKNNVSGPNDVLLQSLLKQLGNG
jgi:hypothetical protein